MLRFAPRHAVLLLLALLLSACDSDGSVEQGFDLDALLAPATQSEIQAARAELLSRELPVRDYQVVAEGNTRLGEAPFVLKIVSHRVPGPAGPVTHYGAILVPNRADAAKLPVLVFGHGGDDGVSVTAATETMQLVLGPDIDEFVIVVPSYRSEPLRAGSDVFTSDGPPSPWNYDVDDALTLLSATLENIPQADPDRIAVLGASRSGGVALLMGLRDPRIDLVVDFYGPSDFLDEMARDIFTELIERPTPDLLSLAGVGYLNDAVVQPLLNNQITLEEARMALIIRSASLFPEGMPDLQVHHGLQDDIVPVTQTEELEEALRALNRSPVSSPSFEVFYYPDGVHDASSLPGAYDRARAALMRLAR